ncbi:MAG TPA: hypothetical protein VFP46_01785 [Candidatus Paceibacterota bacterium]|nr:hypothetical protein [Candidatus Paceibacterota bacterium]
MSSARAAHIALRLGAAFAFLYPPYAAIGDPVSWLAYFPRFMLALPIDKLVLLHGFGIVEVVLALWLLSGWKIRFPAICATAILFAIVAFNASQMDVLFRDLSVALMTLALALSPVYWGNGPEGRDRKAFSETPA